MPKVRVPRRHVTPGELATVLGRRLSGGYVVEPDGDGKVYVRRGQARARVSITDVPGASVFRVRAAGPPVVRVFTGWAAARQVTDALRRSPEFRSL